MYNKLCNSYNIHIPIHLDIKSRYSHNDKFFCVKERVFFFVLLYGPSRIVIILFSVNRNYVP